MRLRKFVNHLLLDIAKCRFALALEILAYRTAYALLDDAVGVNKGQCQPARQLAANRGFSRARQSDEGNQGMV